MTIFQNIKFIISFPPEKDVAEYQAASVNCWLKFAKKKKVGFNTLGLGRNVQL